MNAQDVPIVIVGNKVDQADEGREIFLEDVKDWVDQEYRQNRSWGMPSSCSSFWCFRINVLECSALNTFGIGQIFTTFLTLSKIDLDILARSER